MMMQLDAIVTRNPKDYHQNTTIEIFDPQQLLKIVT
jgi:hypothetical protein